MDTQRFSRIANGLKSASISSVTQTADALRREGKEVLVFSIGRPDFDTPEHIKSAANDALAKGFVHYTHNRGILPMREAVAAYLKRQNGLDYDPKTEIMITAGAQEALMLCTACPARSRRRGAGALAGFPPLLFEHPHAPCRTRALRAQGTRLRLGRRARQRPDQAHDLQQPQQPHGQGLLRRRNARRRRLREEARSARHQRRSL